MRKNVLFVSSILLVIGLAVILHGTLILQEVSGHKPVSENQAIRERAYTEFAIGIVLVGIGLLAGYIYGRPPVSERTEK